MDKKPSRFKRKHKIILSILIVLVALRIALPYIVLHFANKKLATLEGYYGHIDDIDIALYRGAYQIKTMKLVKLDKERKDTTRFLDLKLADLAIEWKPILKGELVGQVMVDSCFMMITKEKNDVKDVVKDSSDFRDVFEGLMPITLNRFELKNSQFVYADPTQNTPLTIEVNALNVLAENLANAYDSSAGVLPASAKLTGIIYGGTVSLNAKIDPYADYPKFDINAKLDSINITKLNQWFRAYGDVDVEKGSFGLYTECAARDGKFKGYVKPVIKDLKVFSLKNDDESVSQLAWEALAGAVSWVFSNKKEDQIASRIDLEGTFNSPDINVGKAIGLVVSNAFIKALQPSIDREINLSSVNKKEGDKGFIETLREQRKEKREERKKNK